MENRRNKPRGRRVCVVAPVHIADDIRVFQKEAVSLAAAGYEVTLLAQAKGHLATSGIAVHQIWAPRTPRLLRFLCLPAILVQALLRRADIYHLHNPDTLPLGLGLKLLGRRVVYDTHEDFSQRLAIREWIPGPLLGLAAKCVIVGERIVAKVADAVIVTQEPVADRLGERAIVIGNPPRTDPDLLDRVRRRAAELPARPEGTELRAIYIGLVNAARGLFEMVEAIESVNREHAVGLVIVGPAVPAELARAQSLPGWRYVEYHPRMPLEQALARVARADVGLATVRDTADMAQADLNKVYEYLALGKPCIVSDFPIWRARLAAIDAGWLVRPGDAEAIADALVAALDPAARRRKAEAGAALVERYNWERESTKLISLYQRLLGKPEAYTSPHEPG